MKQVTLEMPIPNRELNPNVIRHYHQKAKVKAQARTVGYNLAKDYANEFADYSRLKLDLTLYRADKRPVDLDNVLASCKGIIDGIFDGLQCNDNQIDKIIIRRGSVDKINPRIELTISEIKD